MYKGKIKSIPAVDLSVGRQVCRYMNTPLCYNGWVTGIIIIPARFNEGTNEYLVTVAWQGEKVVHPITNINCLKTLVLEYEGYLPFKFQGQDKNDPPNKGLYQIPINPSQWESAIENKLIDNDTIIKFNIDHIATILTL